MNKKLLTVAVACALAAPGVALAQASTVTISGIFKTGLQSLSYSNAVNTRLNPSQMRVVDGASRLIFNSVEDLGNGLSAVGQLDVRFVAADGLAAPTSNPIGSGNTWVGLKSKTLGRVVAGRSDIHWQGASGDTSSKAGAYGATPVSLLNYIGSTSFGVARTQNLVRYDMPNFNGLNAIIAWSANPIGSTEADMINPAPAGGSSRKGDGWNINPSYTNGPFQVGYSYWRAKPDAPVAATNDQRSDSLYGYYKFGGFKVSLSWNKSSLDRAITGTKAAERTVWSLPMMYTWGPNTIVGHYTRASNISSDVLGTVTNNTGARMIALVYSYELSKRTSVGATYAKINNDSAANYNFHNDVRLTSTDAVVAAGESPRMIELTVKHTF